jgi:hypothetical protein
VETTSSLDLGYDMAPFLFTFGGVCYYFVIPEHCHIKGFKRIVFSALKS